jgi:hypothetical protein
MFQITINENSFLKKEDGRSIRDVSFEQSIQSVKQCKHRTENGWCSKSRRQCPLAKLVINNQ